MTFHFRWPWRRLREFEPLDNGHAARAAKAKAEADLRDAVERWPEVHHAKNIFADEVQQAWAGRHDRRRRA